VPAGEDARGSGCSERGRWGREPEAPFDATAKKCEAACPPPRESHRFCQSQWVIAVKRSRAQPHFESPQFRHVMQPSIMTTAAVLQRPHSCAPSGKFALAKASACRVRASNSAPF